MSLSEIEILKQENKSILEGYAKVSDLCKNLIFEIQKRDSHINTLEQEKKKLLEELALLQNHNKDLALKLNNQSIPGEAKTDSEVIETQNRFSSEGKAKQRHK